MFTRVIFPILLSLLMCSCTGQQSIEDGEIPKSVSLSVPFTPQAPFADWAETFNEACEETALIMVEYFIRKEPLSIEQAEKEILELIEWEEGRGFEVDVTLEELSDIASEYFGRDAQIYRGEDVTIEKIKELLVEGLPVIIPAAGQMLGNPYFSGDGPPYHMLVLTGYKRGKFITNDPGTRRGEGYMYKEDVIMNAIHDWAGSKETIRDGEKAMMVVLGLGE